MADPFLNAAGAATQLESAIDGLNDQVARMTKSWYEHSGAMDNLVGKGRTLTSVYSQLFIQFKAGAGVNQQLLKDYGQLLKAQTEIEKQTKKDVEVMKAMNFMAKSSVDQFKSVVSGLSSASSAITNNIKGITGMALGYAELVSVLTKYNRSMFESSRVAEMYGESVADVTSEIGKFSQKTMFTKQGASDLNKAFKDTYLGIPPTTKAVRELAEAMTGRLGYAQEEVAEGLKKLLQLQNTMPNIFDKVRAAQEAYARSTAGGEIAASRLYAQLKVLGVGYQEIRQVMQSVKPASAASSQFMEFEKTMAGANQSLRNSELTIAGKASPALKGIATLSATAAVGVASLSTAFISLTTSMIAFNAVAAMAGDKGMRGLIRMSAMMGMGGGGGGVGGRLLPGLARSTEPSRCGWEEAGLSRQRPQWCKTDNG